MKSVTVYSSMLFALLAGCMPLVEAQQEMQNEAIVQRFFEDLWKEGQLQVADEILADDFVDHRLPPELGVSPIA